MLGSNFCHQGANSQPRVLQTNVQSHVRDRLAIQAPLQEPYVSAIIAYRYITGQRFLE